MGISDIYASSFIVHTKKITKIFEERKKITKCPIMIRQFAWEALIFFQLNRKGNNGRIDKKKKKKVWGVFGS